MKGPLSELGLNDYEEKVYLTLIVEGVSTAKNVTDITGIPYGKVYEVLNSLSSKGFLLVLPTKPMKYRAISPKEVAINIKKDIQEKFEKIENYINKELEPAFTKTKSYSDSKSIFWIVNGRANINKKVEELINKSKKEIKILLSENGIKRLVFFIDLLNEANKRNVKILISGNVTKDNVEDIKDLNFCKVKHNYNVGNHIFLFDNKECLVVDPVLDDENLIYGRDLGALFTGGSFVDLFKCLFDTTMNNSQELEKRISEILNSKK